MGLDTSRGLSPALYGHADYYYQRNQGTKASQILNWLDSDMSRLSQGVRNQPGGGGLYDQIFAAAEREREMEMPAYQPPNITISAPPPPSTVPAPMAIRGNATGVKKKKSATEKTGRNTSGTNQFNRSMFINPVAPLTNINV